MAETLDTICLDQVDSHLPSSYPHVFFWISEASGLSRTKKNRSRLSGQEIHFPVTTRIITFLVGEPDVICHLHPGWGW